MKKIAIISTEPEKFFINKSRGGGEILFDNLIKQFQIKGNCELFVFYPADRTFFDDNQQKNIKFIKINAPNNSNEYINQIKEYLKNTNFDIVLNHNMYNLCATTFLQCHSFAYRVNNINPILKPIKNFFSRKKMLNQQNIFKNANEYSFITVSKKVKNDYIQNFKIQPEKIKVIYPGCNNPDINISEIKKNEYITLGMVAGSSVNKGSYIFLLACGLLKLMNFKFKIKLIAQKYDKDILMKYIVKIFGLEKIMKIFPFQDEMTDFYKSINSLVLPSINEAFGLVVLEAMAYANPAIVSSTAGSSEIITDNNGFIYNRHSFINFLATLKKVINMYNNNYEQYKYYMANAYNTAKKYTWGNFANNILESYDK